MGYQHSEKYLTVLSAHKLGIRLVVVFFKRGSEPRGREILQETSGHRRWVIQSPTTGGSEDRVTLVLLPLDDDVLPCEGSRLKVVGALAETEFEALLKSRSGR